ncbi:MAG: bleomycin hydrolase [Acidobacteriota bacterium]|nr:bleomycin hydrolase [Acidobacteriota bacterium]
MKTKMNVSKLVLILMIITLISFNGIAKEKKAKDGKEKPVYVFTVDTEVKRTPVKNQYRTGTCWCFSTVSYLESELLRLGKEELDLSEMFVVRHTYPLKALNYIQLHGKANHSQGGQSHDVIDQIRQYGIVPEEVYPGMNIDENRHNHGEMTTVLQGILDAILQQKGARVTPRWQEAYEAVLDIYLGKVPENFTYKGKTYTPKTFAQEYVPLNLDDYVELTSYTHHPFYQKFRLELPDNWTYNENYYNVPMADLEKIADYALKNGYSFVWDGDVSEKDFSGGRSDKDHGTGYAVVPEKDWEDMTKDERSEKVTKPVKEKEITQEMRQKTFANYTTTDDHLMHIVGIVHDQTGAKFYLTKNSGGFDQAYKGYVYLSRPYFLLKLTAMMVHKDALPPDIKEKLGLK